MLGQFVDQAYSLGDSNNKTGIFDHSKSCSQKFANLISDRHDKDKKVKQKHFEDIAIVGCSPQGGDGGLSLGQKSDRDNCTNKLSYSARGQDRNKQSKSILKKKTTIKRLVPSELDGADCRS